MAKHLNLEFTHMLCTARRHVRVIRLSDGEQVSYPTVTEAHSALESVGLVRVGKYDQMNERFYMYVEMSDLQTWYETQGEKK